MGYEAYKLIAKYDNVTKSDMVTALKEAGGYVTEIFGSCVSMEIAGPNGIIEMVLLEPGHVNTRFSPGDKVRVTIRFAKPGNVRVADDVVRLLRRLSERYGTVYIRDAETGREVDLDNTGPFIQAVTYAKYNFQYQFPKHRGILRCRDVFGLCRTLAPAVPDVSSFM